MNKLFLLVIPMLFFMGVPAFAVPYCDGGYTQGTFCNSNASEDVTLNQTWIQDIGRGALMKFPLLHDAPQGVLHDLVLNFYVENNNIINSSIRVYCNDGRFDWIRSPYWTDDMNLTVYGDVLNGLKNYDLRYDDFDFQGEGWNSYNLTDLLKDHDGYVGCNQLNDEQYTIFVELADYPVRNKGLYSQDGNLTVLDVGYPYEPFFNFTSSESDDNRPYINVRYDIPVPQHGDLFAILPTIFGQNATFEMNWTNEVGLDYVWFDSNFTGIPTNYSMPSYGDTYYFVTPEIPDSTTFYVRMCGFGWSYWWTSVACSDEEYFTISYPPPLPTMAAVFCYDENTFGSFAVNIIGQNVTNTTTFTHCPNGCRNNGCVESSFDSFLIVLGFFMFILVALWFIRRGN
jgi:hypothetical protein